MGQGDKCLKKRLALVGAVDLAEETHDEIINDALVGNHCHHPVHACASFTREAIGGLVLELGGQKCQ